MNGTETSTLLFAIASYDVVVFLISFLSCLIIIIAARRYARISGRKQDLTSVQSSHTRHTPRIGGVGIFLALLATLYFAPVSLSAAYAQFLAATAILFLVGLAEDVGWHMSPWTRLTAAALASIAAIVLLEVWIPRFDIPGLDPWVGHWAVGVPLTVLLITGIANGFNLIDGVNGLAGWTALCSATALAFIASNAGYWEMVLLASMVAAAILGFLLLNFPFGWIFLGDAGAYTLGFVLSWFGVSILLNAPTATPWAILLTLFWPVADTLLAIYRRSKRKQAAMQPDRLHVHQLVMRSLEIHVLGRKRRSLTNPLTTVFLAPFIALPPLTGILLWDNTLAAFLACVGFGCAFVSAYLWSVPLLRSRSWFAKPTKPAE